MSGLGKRHSDDRRDDCMSNSILEYDSRYK